MDGQRWRQYVIASIANISSISSGICLGWTSPILPKLYDLEQSPLAETITLEQESWIGSLLNFGAVVGAFIGGYLSSKVGRKWSLLSSAAPLLLGWILIAAATNVAAIYAGRVFLGMSVGINFSVTPMYCGEISTDKDRGALGSMLIIFVTIGLLLVYVVGTYVNYSALGYFCASVGSLFAILFYLMPESPIYYLLKNDREAAADSLCIIRGQDLKSIQTELNKISEEAEESKNNTAGYKDLFHGGNLKALIITISLMFFHVFSGIDSLLYYMTNIFEISGTKIDSYTASIIVSAVQVVAASASAVVVDRLGRRSLWIISSGGAAIALSTLGAYFYLYHIESESVDAISFLPLTSMVIFIIMYCAGIATLPWVVEGEIFAVEVRPFAMPIATALCWSFSFLVTRFFGPIGDSVGYHVPFWIFAASCTVSFLFGLFILPETKEKSFQEIQDLLAHRTRTRKSTNIEET